MAATVLATNTSVENSNTTSHTISLPSSIVAGQLLVIGFVCNETPTITAPSGFTKLVEKHETGASTSKLAIFYKTATGSEGSTVTATTGDARQSAHFSYRIGAQYVEIPDTTAGSVGNNNEPNSGSLSPASGSQEYLWLSVTGNAGGQTTSGYPSGYTGNQITNIGGGTFTTTIRTCTKVATASSDDPGVYTVGATVRWIALTLAIRSAAPTPISMDAPAIATISGDVITVSFDYQIDLDTSGVMTISGDEITTSTRENTVFTRQNKSSSPTWTDQTKS